MLIFIALLDAGLLVFLLKTLNDEDIELSTAFLIALVSAIGTSVLIVGLAAAAGIVGFVLGAAIASVILGVVLSAMFGTEIKRAFLIGGIFIAGHILLSIFLGMISR